MHNLKVFFSQLKLSLKIYTRFPEAIFWQIAFPILMLVGLGLLFDGSSEQKLKLVWSESPTVSAQDVLLKRALSEVGLTLEVATPQQAEPKWEDGKLAVLLEQRNGHYSLRVNSYLKEQGMQIVSLVQQAILTNQLLALGASEITHIPVVMTSPGGHRDGPYTQYLLPGLLGLNLLMMGIFSVGMVDVMMRNKGAYKRLATTPLSRYVFLSAQLASRLVMALLSAVLLMLVGTLLFGIYNQGSYFVLLILIVFGLACFASLGYLLASCARNLEAYGGFANIVVLPLMMISGVYFSLDSAPTWLQRVADVLPLTPLIKTLRAVFNDGATLISQASSLALLGGWTAVFFVLAVKRFKWV